MPVTSAGTAPTAEDCRDVIVGGCPQASDALAPANSNIRFADTPRIRRSSGLPYYYYYYLKLWRNKQPGVLNVFSLPLRQRSVTMVAPQPPASAGASRNSLTKGVQIGRAHVCTPA